MRFTLLLIANYQIDAPSRSAELSQDLALSLNFRASTNFKTSEVLH